MERKLDKNGVLNKRRRFTAAENHRLLNLILNQKQHIENKKTDAFWSEKDINWNQLASFFNVNNPSATKRSPVSLKRLYENQKNKITRNNVAKAPVRNNVGVQDNSVADAIAALTNQLESEEDYSFTVENEAQIPQTDTPSCSHEIPPEGNNQKSPRDWNTYNVASLESRTNPKLKTTSGGPSRRRPISSTLTSNDTAKKNLELLNTKLELVKLELAALKTKTEQDMTEHNLRKQSLELDIVLKQSFVTKINDSSKFLDIVMNNSVMNK